MWQASGVRVWRSLDGVPGDLAPTVVTIGNFDGVHLGHRHLIACARAEADERGITVVAVTFDPHPMAVLRPEHAPAPLSDIEERAALLAEAGVDDVLVLPFSREMAAWTPAEFVQRVLVDTLHCAAVVVGANFRFGNRAAGDVTTLRNDDRFEAVGVSLDGGPQVWSSTYVRTCLADGDVEGAAVALGRPYSVRGQVTRGDQRGRELGFPTANVPPRGQAAPADGVYAGRLRLLDDVDAPGEWLPAAISVGTNPTFAGDRDPRVEAYVLPSTALRGGDRDDLDLYDHVVEVAFVARLRGMVRFDGVDELVAEMHRDVQRTREVLRG